MSKCCIETLGSVYRSRYPGATKAVTELLKDSLHSRIQIYTVRRKGVGVFASRRGIRLFGAISFILTWVIKLQLHHRNIRMYLD